MKAIFPRLRTHLILNATAEKHSIIERISVAGTSLTLTSTPLLHLSKSTHHRYRYKTLCCAADAALILSSFTFIFFQIFTYDTWHAAKNRLLAKILLNNFYTSYHSLSVALSVSRILLFSATISIFFSRRRRSRESFFGKHRAAGATSSRSAGVSAYSNPNGYFFCSISSTFQTQITHRQTGRLIRSLRRNEHK